MKESFDKNISERYGPDTIPDNFTEINQEYTPDFYLYQDAQGGNIPAGLDDQVTPNPATGLDLEIPKPEANDNYVNTSVMFPIGNSFYRVELIGQKIYFNNNTNG